MFEQFVTSINYPELIKLQSNMPAPFVGCIDVKKLPRSNKGVKIMTKRLVRNFGHRK